MGTEGRMSYAIMGPAILLALLVAFFSVRSINFAKPRLFILTESVLILIILNFFLLRGFLLALCYSLTGIIQIRKFWKFALPEITGKYLKPAMVILIITISISCAHFSYSIIKFVPKLPPDKKEINFALGTLQFYDEYSRLLHMGLLAQDSQIQGIIFPKDTWVYFYETGEIEMVKLGGKELIIQGIYCAESSNVNFYKSGKIKHATLGKSQEIHGKVYYEGEAIYFNENGSVKKVRR